MQKLDLFLICCFFSQCFIFRDSKSRFFFSEQLVGYSAFSVAAKIGVSTNQRAAFRIDVTSEGEWFVPGPLFTVVFLHQPFYDSVSRFLTFQSGRLTRCGRKSSTLGPYFEAKFFIIKLYESL